MIYKLYNNHWNSWPTWNTKFYKFRKLFEYLDKARRPSDPDFDRIRSSYWYFDMRAQLTMFYDGDVRGAGGKRMKYDPNNRYVN